MEIEKKLVQISECGVEDIRDLRNLFLHENNFQFIYNKCYENCWANSWRIQVQDIPIGYGSAWGETNRDIRDTIFEFYLTNPYRKYATSLFRKFQSVCGADYVICQSNDIDLSCRMFESCIQIEAEAILFEDHFQTNLPLSEYIYRKRLPGDHLPGDTSDRVLVLGGVIVATGGYLLNYNWPYADLYMAVNDNYRQRGLGTLIVQELKKEIYQMGRVPAARCNIRNHASKSTLLKAGFRVCGFLVKGKIRKPEMGMDILD